MPIQDPPPVVLDATLRDGGYYTNWNFPRGVVERMAIALCDAGVDVYVASSFDEYAALQADGVALADRGDPREDLGFVLPDPQRFRDHPLG